MSSTFYRRARDLFVKVMALSESERDAWLEQACAGEPDLLSRVRALMEASIAEPEIDASSSPPRVPVIPGYRIERLIATGGMGSVYEAHEERSHLRVAIKVIRPEQVSESALRRFAHETRTLARLNHACIARVFSAGVTQDAAGTSQPYFVMEYVDGLALDEYLAQNALTIEQRLGLLIRVCEGLEHAHQRAIIHRDLKPANILVTADGQPKILDFGVARATDPEERLTVTKDLGKLIGTLQYMSPEQAQGDADAVDTRSDVYALGVIAYEVLSGSPPLDATLPPAQLLRLIQDETPPPLSSADRTFRGDIETMVGMALEKDPARRYPSAAAFGADLSRFLNDEPILARPPSTWYRLTKFSKRNKAVVAGLALAGASAIFAVVSLAVLRIQEREAYLERELIYLDTGQVRDPTTALARYSELEAEFGELPIASQAHRLRIELVIRPTVQLIRQADALLDGHRGHAGIAELLLARAHYVLFSSELDDSDDAQELLAEAIGLGSLGGADRLYAQSLLATSHASCYELLTQAVELEPFHIEARRALMSMLAIELRVDELETFAQFDQPGRVGGKSRADWHAALATVVEWIGQRRTLSTSDIASAGPLVQFLHDFISAGWTLTPSLEFRLGIKQDADSKQQALSRLEATLAPIAELTGADASGFRLSRQVADQLGICLPPTAAEAWARLCTTEPTLEDVNTLDSPSLSYVYAVRLPRSQNQAAIPALESAMKAGRGSALGLRSHAQAMLAIVKSDELRKQPGPIELTSEILDLYYTLDYEDLHYGFEVQQLVATLAGSNVRQADFARSLLDRQRLIHAENEQILRQIDLRMIEVDLNQRAYALALRRCDDLLHDNPKDVVAHRLRAEALQGLAYISSEEMTGPMQPKQPRLRPIGERSRLP